MAFVLIGRIIAVDKQQTIASKTDATKTFQRRQVYLDCSRYDSITGEQLQENRPLLEFGGKGLDQLNELVRQGLKKGDLVSIEFAVQGNTYKDAQGNTKNYTFIRPYSIERYVPRSQQVQQQQQTQQPAPAPQPAPQPQAAAPAPAPQAQQANDAFTQRPENDGLPF
jgi:pyruvate/2-oxoglutarate dehydrogenase complex dihydrolipoamide acyltransferase (E2) component